VVGCLICVAVDSFWPTVDILIMHSVGTGKTLCIMTYMQHEICHIIVTYVTSAKMCDSKLSTISASMCIIPRKIDLTKPALWSLVLLVVV
jgi:hypothetical protein